MKDEVRDVVEAEERINYEKRMGKQWTTDLKPLNTTWEKPYLSKAPAIVLLFKQVNVFTSCFYIFLNCDFKCANKIRSEIRP